MKQQLLKCDDIESMSELYKEVRIEFAKQNSGKNNPMYGRKFKRSKETRQKISEAKLGTRNPMYGKHLSEETRQKCSDSLKGHKGYWKGKIQPKDAVEKRAAANRGKKRSVETRRKMSESLKGLRWFTDGKTNAYARKCPDGFRPGMTRKRSK